MVSNEEQVSAAFSKQSSVFDTQYKENKLSEYLRAIFREEVLSGLKPNSSILELNCGTGMDAIYFAEKGHSVYATDNAPGMLEQLKNKIAGTSLEKNITTHLLSFHHIDELKGQTFDYIISNFGGLNCTNDLKDVLLKLSPLLKENGKVSLMVMPKVCPWELVQVVKGKFKTAFRRFKKETVAHIEGQYFSCYYYNPGYVIRNLRKEFEVLRLKGVFIFVPPEFYQNFVERYPTLFRFLSKVDHLISGIFPFNRCCDHFLITLRKKRSGSY